MRKRLKPYLPDSTIVKCVHLGVPVDQFKFKLRKSVNKGCTFLQISRLDYKKGVDVSINVFHRYLKEIDSTAKFIIAGEGPLWNQLHTQVEKLGIVSNVIFLGKIDQAKVLELLQTSDVLLQHSVVAPDGDMEGIPIILMEAMACGLPVVSTYHSGIPELITNGETGLLVNEKDADAYFESLVSLSKIDIASMSRNARTCIEDNFNAIKNYDKLCDNIFAIINYID